MGTIGESAFEGAECLFALNDVNEVNQEENLINVSYFRNIGAKAFEGAAATSIIIGDYVEGIGQGAFGKMPNLTTINTSMTGGDRDASFDTGAREDAYFAYIFASDYDWTNGTYYEAQYLLDADDPDSMVYYYVANKIDYIYTGNVIAEYAFSNTDMIGSMSIDNVTQISDYGFYKNTGMDDFAIDEQIELESIGKYSFYQAKITSFSFGESLTYIGYNAFTGATNATTGESPTITCVGDEARGATWYFLNENDVRVQDPLNADEDMYIYANGIDSSSTYDYGLEKE